MQIESEHKIIHFEVHLMNSRREGRAHLLQEVALLIIWKLLLLLLLIPMLLLIQMQLQIQIQIQIH